jgi:hypothetical protein
MIRTVGLRNKIDVVSNLAAPPSVWERLADRPNIAIATSYHPHYWDGVGAYLRKRRQIESLGVHCGQVSVVAWPPGDLGEVKGAVEELRSRSIYVEVLPFWGQHGGRKYPDSYSSEDWEWISGEVTEVHGDNRANDHTKGILCRTGMDYVAVTSAGDIMRCYMSTTQDKLGSLLDDEINLPTSPTPCPHDRCACSGMWQFMVES